MKTRLALTALAVVLLAPRVEAAPDPLSAGGLNKAIIDAATGSVRVTLTKTQHVRLSGRERDAKRKGGVLRIRRALEDVVVTLPEGIELDITAATGAVHIEGATRALEIEAGSGVVVVAGGLDKARITSGAGAVKLTTTLAKAADVRVRTGSGDISITAGGAADLRVEARSTSGEVTGGGLSEPGAKARLRLESGSGDITVVRPGRR